MTFNQKLVIKTNLNTCNKYVCNKISKHSPSNNTFLHRVVLFSMALKPIWQGTVMKGDLTNDLKLDVTFTVDFCIKDITLEMCLFYYIYIREKPDCC